MTNTQRWLKTRPMRVCMCVCVCVCVCVADATSLSEHNRDESKSFSWSVLSLSLSLSQPPKEEFTGSTILFVFSLLIGTIDHAKSAWKPLDDIFALYQRLPFSFLLFFFLIDERWEIWLVLVRIKKPQRNEQKKKKYLCAFVTALRR